MNEFGGKAAGLKLLQKLKIPVPKWMALSYADAKQIDDARLDSVISNFSSNDLLAVRSSALNEDGVEKSFAGIFESKLNVAPVRSALHEAIKFVIASGTTNRVTDYDDVENKIGVVIQKMVLPVISGVAFTKAIDTNGEDVVLIEVICGLADRLVCGAVTPTQVKVPVRDKIIAMNEVQVSGVLIPGLEKINLLLEQIQKIITTAKNPLDLEWCIDSNDVVWFVQARPITAPVLIKKQFGGGALPIVSGTAIGKAFVISETAYESNQQLIEKKVSEFPQGAILIAKYTETSFIPAMKRAKGIITETGGILSHAAILSRELGVPCIVNYPGATTKFKTGDQIFMNGATGEINGEHDTIDESSWFDEAWNFDQMFKVPTAQGHIFVEPLPNRLNVIAPLGDDLTESWIRKQFGVQPKIVRDWYKFGAWNENQFRKKLPGYKQILDRAYTVARSGSARQVNRFYEDTLDFIRKYIPLENNATNAAAKFYYNEIIVGPYIILDVIFPRAIAMREMYYNTAHHLYSAGKTFRDFLGGAKIKGIPKSYNDFAKAVSDRRNSIWEIMSEMHPMLADYWTDGFQDKFMGDALDAIEIPKDKRQYPYKVLFDNLAKIKKMT